MVHYGIGIYGVLRGKTNDRNTVSWKNKSSILSLYNDNLMVLAESLAAIGSGTRGFQKAQVGSNER